MSDYFLRSLNFVLKWEGEKAVKDTGGWTRFGISNKAYPNFTPQQIKDLTKQQASQIYKRDYWLKAGCDLAPWPICLILFDTAVNMGVARAKKFFIASLIEDKENISQITQSFINQREQLYKKLAKRQKYAPYFKGWMNRLNDLREEILK